MKLSALILALLLSFSAMSQTKPITKKEKPITKTEWLQLMKVADRTSKQYLLTYGRQQGWLK